MQNKAGNISPESLERKHEVSEKRVRNPLIVGGAAFCLVIFAIAVASMEIHFLKQTRRMHWMVPLGILVAPNLAPLERFPKPNLSIDDDHSERVALYAAENKKLNSYGWVDRSNGIVHIPIDRAMDLLLQRGLPARTNGVSGTDGSELELIQNIHNSP